MKAKRHLLSMLLILFVISISNVSNLQAAPKESAKATAKKSNPAAKKASTSKKNPKLAQPKKSSPQAKNTKNIEKIAVKTKAPKSAKSATSTKTAQTKKAKKALQIAKLRAPESWKETEELVLASSAALVLGQEDGQTYFQKKANQVVPIASVTKLMTAMVVLDAHPDLAANIVIADDDIDYLRGSRSRLSVGTNLPRETALLLALMSSENRAANALARHYPGGMNAFIPAMNAKALALGMKNTHFYDPTGLTEKNVSTAHDLARMVAAAHRYPLIREFSTSSDHTLINENGHETVYRNTNPLVNSSDWEVGVSKTGFIHEAGKCLVMQAVVANRPVIIVLLDSNASKARVADANRIRRWMEYMQTSRVATKNGRS